MTFIPKNPLSFPKISYTPSTPPGTKGIFAKEDGFYEVDEFGNESKIGGDGNGLSPTVDKGAGDNSITIGEGCDATGECSVASGKGTVASSNLLLSFQDISFISYENDILTLTSSDGFFDNNQVYAFRIENFNTKIYIDIVKVLSSIKEENNWKFTIEKPISKLNLEIPSQTIIQAIIVDSSISANNQHSEGNSSYAIGEASHSEGNETLSADEYTHAEGWGTIAYGRASHTEGWCTKTLENYAHAEGCHTVAGYCSHSEGSGTEALGVYAHSEGYNTYASGDGSHTEGANCRAVGNYSHAENCNTKAIGNNTHSEGLSTQATGDNSHAEGSATTSKGISSHIEGSSSIVAPEDSINCDSAKAISKFNSNKNYSLAYGEASHVEGKNNLAVGIASHTEGGKNVSGGDFAHSEGYNTKSLGAYAHTEGYMTEATQHSSHAEGYSTKSNGNFCHTEGVETESTGIGCHSEGYQSKSFSYYSHAEGYKCMSVGNYSHAEGEQTTAAGKGSHTEGLGTQANGDYQHTQGKWNVIDNEQKYANIIGNGTSNVNRANIHTVDWNGNAWYQGNVTVGDNKEELATQTYVDSKIASMVDSAPETLDTLNELSQALGDDPNFATTVATEIGKKADTTYVDEKTSEVQNNLDGTYPLIYEMYDERIPNLETKMEYVDEVLSTHNGEILNLMSGKADTSYVDKTVEDGDIRLENEIIGLQQDLQSLESDVYEQISGFTSELNAALQEIITIQEDLMTPNGDGVKY